VIELFATTLATLFVVIDPPGCAPIFASLTQRTSAAWRRRMAFRAVVNAGAILLLFALIGEALLRTLGIGMPAFRIAGGIMLFLIALEMVFEKRQERRQNRAQETIHRSAVPHDDQTADDISVFPMAIPMIAGPGSIASVMLLTSRSEGLAGTTVVLTALLLILLLTYAALLAAATILRVLGPQIEAVVTRLLGVLLGALATQFVIDGVRLSLQA
jgi:multiple antibiotic resistance protein